jgi:hypothetical protein
VSLEELEAVAGLMVRRDRKYLVTDRQLATLLAQLAPGTRVLEIDGRRSFDYSSTYFDTPEATCYYLTARRRRRRFKVRTRQYGPGGPVFLEVKTRGPRGITVKDRVGTLATPTDAFSVAGASLGGAFRPASPLATVLEGDGASWMADSPRPRPGAPRGASRPGAASPASPASPLSPAALAASPVTLAASPVTPELPELDDATALDVALGVALERGAAVPEWADFWPAVEVRYRRTTLLLPDGGRATIDTDVVWGPPGEPGTGVTGLVILETKTPGPATSLDRAAWALGLRPQPLSKFGVAMASTHRDLASANRWHRVVRRCEGSVA